MRIAVDYKGEKIYFVVKDGILSIICLLKEDFDGDDHNVSLIMYTITPDITGITLHSKIRTKHKNDMIASCPTMDRFISLKYTTGSSVDMQKIADNFTADRAIMKGIKVVLQAKKVLDRDHSISFRSENVFNSIKESIGYEFEENSSSKMVRLIRLETGEIIAIIEAINYVTRFKDMEEFINFGRHFATIGLVFNSLNY